MIFNMCDIISTYITSGGDFKIFSLQVKVCSIRPRGLTALVKISDPNKRVTYNHVAFTHRTAWIVVPPLYDCLVQIFLPFNKV